MISRISLTLSIVCVCLAFTGWHTRAQNIPVIQSPDRQIMTHPLDAVTVSADGSLIVSGGRDNVVRLWNAGSGELRGQMSGHTGWITRVALSPDGGTIASGSQDNSVRLWDANTFAGRTSLTQHSLSITGVAFSPDGRLLVTTGLDGLIWLGDAVSGAEIARLTNFNGAVWSVAFSPDGRRLATGSEDGNIWLWGLYDNAITRLGGHTGAVTALTFSPDGTRLLSSSWDRSARLWAVADAPPQTGGPLMALTGHYGPVTGVAFSSRGLISVSLDGAARLWDVGSGQTKAVLQGSASMLGSAAMSADGKWLVTAGIDGLLESWDIESQLPQQVALAPTLPPAPVIQPTAEPYAFLPVFTAQPPPTYVPQIATHAPPPETQAEAPAVQAGGTTLSLPTVNVFAPIVTFPLDGVSWAIDPWERNIGHLQGTAWFNSGGNVVMGGHSSYPNGRPGIFAGLYQLNIGDPIIVMVDGGERRYVVTEKFSVHYDDLRVAYPSADSRLTLITCDLPSYNPDTQFYSERLVVVAVPG